jgi:general secretion pathway protein A
MSFLARVAKLVDARDLKSLGATHRAGSSPAPGTMPAGMTSYSHIVCRIIPMYTAHFGLKAAPFSLTPDPHYLYLSERHREALSQLEYSINESSGFVLLAGEVGTGKTMLCRCLMARLPANVDIVFLSNPCASPLELLIALFDELRISRDELFTPKDFNDVLKTYLVTARSVGRNTVIVLDESQNLSVAVLEQVRLLNNLETDNHKLLQIILVGQPELNNLLRRKNLRQLSQRVTARANLTSLSFKDTQAYIEHRLAVAGVRKSLFTKPAMRQIYQYSRGIPRLINIICERSLLDGYLENQAIIKPSTVNKAIRGVGNRYFQQQTAFRWATGALVLTLLIAAGVYKDIWFPATWQATLLSALQAHSPEPPAMPTNSTPVAPTQPVAQATPPTVKVEATPPPAPAPPAESNLLDLLNNPTIHSDTQAAFSTLFQLWNVNYDNLQGKTACERAATQGLACLYHTGSWDDIRRFNRPTIVELITDKSKAHHVTVVKLKDNIATLSFNGQTYQFPTNKISEYWLGAFLILWKPPLMPIPVLKQGISHDSVKWIRQNLNTVQHIVEDEKKLSPRFDNALKRRIAEFQQQQNMTADGVAGEQTLLLLSAQASGEPRLNAE